MRTRLKRALGQVLLVVVLGLALASGAATCDDSCRGDECDYKEYQESGEEAIEDDYWREKQRDLPDRYRYGDDYEDYKDDQFERDLPSHFDDEW